MVSRILRLVFVAAGIVLLTFALTACGGDDGGSEVDQALLDTMVAEGATEEQARCFLSELGDDAERLFAAEDEDLSEDDQEKLLDAFEECGGEL